MTTIQYILLLIFLVATLIGYFIINKVPSLLHTPLMSGMNALSGVTIIGALAATVAAVNSGKDVFAYIFGTLAIILAMVNVVGGFLVTNRMLAMFSKKKVKRNV